jgi:N-methylhydantoinase A/oxoprolinase/acetone carboxylase beta subunit
MGFRIGIDVGGTFTDFILALPDGRHRAVQGARRRSTTRAAA